MSHARSLPLFLACALIAIVAVVSAPAPPKRSGTGESKMDRERTIVVKRLPYAYFYPFNLWPLPKYPVEAIEESHETFQFRRTVQGMAKAG